MSENTKTIPDMISVNTEALRQLITTILYYPPYAIQELVATTSLDTFYPDQTKNPINVLTKQLYDAITPIKSGVLVKRVGGGPIWNEDHNRDFSEVVVISMEPFILISKDGTTLWKKDMKTEDFIGIMTLDPNLFEQLKHRFHYLNK